MPTEEKTMTMIQFLDLDRILREHFGFKYRRVIDAKIPGSTVAGDEFILYFEEAHLMLPLRNN